MGTFLSYLTDILLIHPREYQVREAIPHTWPSFHYLKSIFGSVTLVSYNREFMGTTNKNSLAELIVDLK